MVSLQIISPKKMSDPRFVKFLGEEIESFLDENENQNTLRKTRQDISLFKPFAAR